jgi:hypothetical protein
MSKLRRIKAGNDFCSKLLECVEDIKTKHQTVEDTTASYGNEVSHGAVMSLIDRGINLDIAQYKKLIHFPHSYNLKLIRFLIEMYPNSSIQPSGNFIYPEGGYMGWHTNSDFPCKRVYITVVDDSYKSGFKYVNGRNVIDDVDDEKIIIREFDISKTEPFWHCVYSNTNRYSFGFRIEEL